MNKKLPDISKEIVEIKIIKKDIAVIDEKIGNNQKAVLKQLEANSVTFNDKLTLILGEAKKTNGRITKLEDNWIPREDLEKLEKETSVMRFLQKNKSVSGLVILGLYMLSQIMTIDNFQKVINFFF